MNALPDITFDTTLVALTGAGVSAESGVKTFRDHGGLWEEHRIEDVATPQAWARDPETVQRFYNERRKQLLSVEPNEAHRALAELEKHCRVRVITQNIDDLHERAGSRDVLHLHGQLRMARSSIDEDHVQPIDGWEIRMGELCPGGSQLRPHVVWFGEAVPNIPIAADRVAKADIVLIVGTSLAVYPAAGLVHYANPGTPIIAIDPGTLPLPPGSYVHHLQTTATAGMRQLLERWIK